MLSTFSPNASQELSKASWSSWGISPLSSSAASQAESKSRRNDSSSSKSDIAFEISCGAIGPVPIVGWLLSKGARPLERADVDDLGVIILLSLFGGMVFLKKLEGVLKAHPGSK